ncbi:MAG: LamG domain-containing protein, partial [Nanoarchaeota archaeon]|nr:LamG domain-containing protein [Nanoarchaeota archaeon]
EEGTGSIIPDIDSSLVSWWRMDDTNGSSNSVIDYMGRNNGTAVNAVQTDAGKLGKGMSFDGNGDYVLTSASETNLGINNQSFSISLWFNAPDGTAQRDMFSSEYNGGASNSEGFNIFLSNSGTLFGRFINSSRSRIQVFGNTNSDNSQWQHVIFIWNKEQNNCSIYQNSVFKTSLDCFGHNVTRGDPITIGGYAFSPTVNNFNGTIDDVMIFNRSLSSDEILSIYNATKYQHTQNLSEGAHTFKAYTQDLAGNMANSSLINFNTDTGYPALVLLIPKNNSGDNDGNVTFIFNATDLNSVAGNIINCSLIINNAVNLTNASVVNGINTSFIVNELGAGSYNWSINCSDTAGNINNSAVWELAVVKTSSEFSGGTTDLSAVNISNITNLVLDSPNYGKINFSESVDLSSGGNIDSFVNISFNRIEINTTGISALDKSARLTLYNLTYSNPRVLKDGSVCSDCSEVGYTSSTGTFVFDVTGFSVYSAEETPATATPATDAGSSGGGGGSALTKINEDFSVDTEELKVRIVLNDVKEREIKIKNTGENNITIKAKLEGEGMKEIIAFENDKLLLGVGEEGVLKFNISVKELEIYTGKIILSSSRKTKEVLVTINTQSKETLFDISLAIPENTISKDETLKAQVNLIPVGEKGVDVTLKYLIKDFKGKVYYEESETFYIDEQKSFAKEFKTNKLEYGSYVLGIEMTYAGGFASTSSHFEVKEEEKPATFIKAYYMYFIVIIILIIAVLFVIFELRKMQKYKRYKR